MLPSTTCPSGLYGMGGNGDRGKFGFINVSTGAATLLGSLGTSPLDVGLDGDPATGAGGASATTNRGGFLRWIRPHCRSGATSTP